MSKGNPFLALRLTRDQQDALRADAEESGRTVSDLVRQLLAEHVARRGQLAASNVLSRRQGPTRARRSRQASRPVRLQRAVSEIEDLLADYEEWQANLPESLQDTATGAALVETVDNLQQAVDLLNAITPPRGFGRD